MTRCRTAERTAWFDDEAGPVVRPYAMTRGRTSSAAEAPARPDRAGRRREPRGRRRRSRTRRCPRSTSTSSSCAGDTPQSVAELAAELDLPVGVVRVLIGDLLDAELVHVTRPVPPAELPDESILREVINGLRAL